MPQSGRQLPEIAIKIRFIAPDYSELKTDHVNWTLERGLNILDMVILLSFTKSDLIPFIRKATTLKHNPSWFSKNQRMECTKSETREE